VRAFPLLLHELAKPGQDEFAVLLISLYASALSVSRNTPAVLLLVCVASGFGKCAFEVQSWPSYCYLLFC